jgi:hypothetical protein
VIALDPGTITTIQGVGILNSGIRFVSRPKAIQVRAHLGVQEQHAPKMLSRSHAESVLDLLYMDGKVILYSLQWY